MVGHRKDRMRIKITAQNERALEEIELPVLNTAAALGYDSVRLKIRERKNVVSSTWNLVRKRR